MALSVSTLPDGRLLLNVTSPQLGDSLKAVVVHEGMTFANVMWWPFVTQMFMIPSRRLEVINGEMGIGFTNAKMRKIINDMKFALVLKFSMRFPPIDILR